MSDNEIKPIAGASQFPHGVDELSDQELDDISGGLNLRLNAAFFKQSNLSFSQETGGGGCGSSKSAFAAETVESAGLQIIITDASAEDLEFLGGLLGDAAAIEGSD